MNEQIIDPEKRQSKQHKTKQVSQFMALHTDIVAQGYRLNDDGVQTATVPLARIPVFGASGKERGQSEASQPTIPIRPKNTKRAQRSLPSLESGSDSNEKHEET